MAGAARLGRQSNPGKTKKIMYLDTENTVYVCIDSSNGSVKILTPRNLKLTVIELRVDDRDPESTDAAEAKLLETDMDTETIDLP